MLYVHNEIIFKRKGGRKS